MTDQERQRRVAFGVRLRVLREDAGYLTGKEFAERLGWHPSKVSRIENGRLSITDVDAVTWLEATGASGEIIAELKDELWSLKLEENRWKRQLRDGHRARQERGKETEHEARNFRIFELTVVPGLIQTAEYARYVFLGGADLMQTPRDTDEAVQARMERQSILYSQDKMIEFLIGESAFRYPICPPAVMAAQIDRIMALMGLPGVRLGILPFDAQLPYIPMHGFSLVDDQVRVETTDSEDHTRDPEKHALYTRLLDALWGIAAEGDEARSILSKLLTSRT